MPERWVGVVVGRNDVVAVDAEVPKDGPIVILADNEWPVQKGDRAAAYSVLHQQVTNYCRENKITSVVVKESAVNRGGTKKAHLEAAELRGVVISAAASIAPTRVVAKATVSRTFGSRKADDYLSDDGFWKDQIRGDLRKGSREAVLILLAARK